MLIFLVICLAVAGYTTYNLLIKLEKYEDELERNQNLIQTHKQIPNLKRMICRSNQIS